VSSLAEITHAALVASGLGQRDFAKALGVGASTVAHLLKGGKVKRPTVEALADYCPERAEEIKEAAKIYDPTATRGGRTPRPKTSRDRMDLQTKQSDDVQSGDTPRLPQQQTEPREGERVWHPDPQWAMMAAVWPSLSTEVHVDLVNRANKAAAKMARPPAPARPKEVG
jgi:transcriptional regulator with XRE-family HTH domain